MSTAAPGEARPRVGEWLPGIELLRAGLAVAVVAWHTRLLGMPGVCTPRFRVLPVSWVDVVSFNFLCLAVPVFFLVSFFLYIRQRQAGRATLGQRLEYVVALFAFWVGLLTLARGGFSQVHATLGLDWAGWGAFLVTGAESPFYFFFSLGLLTLAAEWAWRRSARVQAGLFFASTLAIVGLGLLAVGGLPWATAYTNPLNFLPFVFLAALCAGRYGPLPRSWLVGSAAVFVLAGVAEWLWLPHAGHAPFNQCAMPPYTRVSAVAGAAALFLLSFEWRREPPAWVRTLADHSLGLYCFHPFVMAYLFIVMGALTSVGERVLYFAGVLAGSLVGAALLRRAFRHRLV